MFSKRKYCCLFFFYILCIKFILSGFSEENFIWALDTFGKSKSNGCKHKHMDLFTSRPFYNIMWLYFRSNAKIGNCHVTGNGIVCTRYKAEQKSVSFVLQNHFNAIYCLVKRWWVVYLSLKRCNVYCISFLDNPSHWMLNRPLSLVSFWWLLKVLLVTLV